MTLRKNIICILGLGYVGLPTATILAKHGYRVHGVDVNPTVIETINRGDIHIVEDGLASLVKKVVSAGNLSASLEPSPADIFIITVPTPLKNDYIPDIDYVLAAASAIAPHIKPGNLLILESTSPVGTTEKVRDLLQKLDAPVDEIDIAYCPERILPGAILTELIENNRIIGGLTPQASERAREFYASFVKGELIITNARTAEMVKLAENAYRNVNIAFANELSMICDESGINVWELIACANKHPRVNIHKPSAGVGGHCVAVDPLFISHQAKDNAKLISTAHHRNTEKTKWVIEKIRHAAYEFTKEFHRPPTIACLGIAYKANSDDIRESPSLAITKVLLREKYAILAVDPLISRPLDINLTPLADALTQGDIFVHLVGHNAFHEAVIPSDKRILDFCGISEKHS
ncbi:MAG: UDP-N-acetyl-D-mannosamine dehydrogenase [bacterium]|nr:UDP-N-acetyl-D-mannosamine dehydrogenase [bacterium]